MSATAAAATSILAPAATTIALGQLHLQQHQRQHQQHLMRAERDILKLILSLLSSPATFVA